MVTFVCVSVGARSTWTTNGSERTDDPFQHDEELCLFIRRGQDDRSRFCYV